MNTASHVFHDLWRTHAAEKRRFSELDVWIQLARRLERDGFDAIFFADVIELNGARCSAATSSAPAPPS